VTFKGYGNFQFLFNSNETNVLHRVPLSEDIISVPQTYITEQLDLFLLVETSSHFQILKIDLDNFGNKKEKKE